MDVGVDIGKRRVSIGIPAMRAARTIDLDKSKERITRASELRRISVWIRTWIPEHARLWVELPVMGWAAKNPLTMMEMGQTIGAVIAGSSGHVEMVHQAAWKSSLIGSGGADKAEIAAWLHQGLDQLGAVCENQDEIDAMCIGLYGQHRWHDELRKYEVSANGRARRPVGPLCRRAPTRRGRSAGAGAS